MVGHARDRSALTGPHQLGLREPRGTRGTRRRRDLGLRKLVDQVMKLLFIRHRRLVPAYATSESCDRGSLGGSHADRSTNLSPGSRKVDLTAFTTWPLQRPSRGCARRRWLPFCEMRPAPPRRREPGAPRRLLGVNFRDRRLAGSIVQGRLLHGQRGRAFSEQGVNP